MKSTLRKRASAFHEVMDRERNSVIVLSYGIETMEVAERWLSHQTLLLGT